MIVQIRRFLWQPAPVSCRTSRGPPLIAYSHHPLFLD
nr:MAG TPA: hypothetical protein [Bacteriophage sp.]